MSNPPGSLPDMMLSYGWKAEPWVIQTPLALFQMVELFTLTAQLLSIHKAPPWASPPPEVIRPFFPSVLEFTFVVFPLADQMAPPNASPPIPPPPVTVDLETVENSTV